MANVLIVDVIVTSGCIHLYLLSNVTLCSFRDVSIMYLSHVVIPRCSDREDQKCKQVMSIHCKRPHSFGALGLLDTHRDVGSNK